MIPRCCGLEWQGRTVLPRNCLESSFALLGFFGLYLMILLVALCSILGRALLLIFITLISFMDNKMPTIPKCIQKFQFSLCSI